MKLRALNLSAAFMFAWLMPTAPVHGEAITGTALQKSQAYYQKGIAAERSGDAEAAKSAYEAALKYYPRNANARYRLGQVKSNFTNIAAKGRKAKLDTIIIQEFRMDDATLKEALSALQVLVEKETKNEVLPNFIIQDASGALGQAKVSIVLKSLPAGTILNYLLEQVNARARYDEHAIVVMPR